jgi:hypothetical protein
MNDAAWVTLTTCTTVFEAEMVRQQLEGEGIPVLVKGAKPGIFGPGFQGAVPGGVDVCVPSPEVDAARAVLGIAD